MQEKLDKINLTMEDYIKIKQALPNFKKDFNNDKDKEKVVTNLYKARYYLKMAPSEMMEFFNCSKRGLQHRLKLAGWQYNGFEAQQLSAKKKDYSAINKKIMKKIVENNFSSGVEKDIRKLISVKLEAAIDAEIVVGLATRSIIAGNEIDIPIIIMDNNKLYKYAIEVNGDVWHDNKQCQDAIKMAKAENLGYKSFTIQQSGNTRIQREEYGSIGIQIDNIIKAIIKDMKHSKAS